MTLKRVKSETSGLTNHKNNWKEAGVEDLNRENRYRILWILAKNIKTFM